MQASTNTVDDLLEQWEYIKRKRLPYATGIEDLSDYINFKIQIDDYAHCLRNSRLTNNSAEEELYTVKFTELLSKFTQDYVYRALKDDNQTQP